MMKGIWKYSHLLPSVNEEAKITLGEGNTPLVKSNRLGKQWGLDHLYFKLEQTNPTGSYKDRFAAFAIADLIQKKSPVCIATSSGNAGSALSAYAAAAGIHCFLAIVDGAPAGKLIQMRAYGAETLMVKGFGLDVQVTNEVMDGLRELAKGLQIPVHISAFHYSPLAMDGVQTIAFEIAEELPDFRGHIFPPVGGGGMTLAMIKGFKKWKEVHAGYRIPSVHCVQPEGNDTIASALRNGKSKAQSVEKSLTAVSGLQVPNVIDGDWLIQECRDTGGTGYAVSDEDVYRCQEDMAKMEGIYAEPAGAVALAGVMKALKNGEISRYDQVICIVTGHGFKDPSSVERIAKLAKDQYFQTAGETLVYIQSQLKKSNFNT